MTLASLSPATTNIGGPAFTLTLMGSGFSAQSTLLWNGNAQPTTFVNATKLTAQISAAEIAATGSDAVSVSDPTFGLSGSLPFTVSPAPLALNTISPTTVTVGGPAFMLTALGTSFTGTSVIEWNGAALTTTLVSSKELLAQVPAGDINATGTASVLVSDPNSPPGTTGTLTLTIASPSKDAVSFQINSAHNGAISFANVSLPFPSSPAWSVDVGGTPSYALITHGEVIVTVQVSASVSEVLALDQATGATVWEQPIGSPANATYDNGRVFVVYGGAAEDTLEAFDVDTGVPAWSTSLVGRIVFSGLLTAADGVVYVGAEGIVNANDESTGARLWTQGVDGTWMSPAVTVDGIYTSFLCTTTDLRPATGEVIWFKNNGCSGGGGGAVPVVANQLLYAPNTTSGSNGSILNAETGASDGSYISGWAPAFTSSMGYFLQSGTLHGVTLSNNISQWSFAGDGQLAGAPIAVNQYVFIGSSSGNLYAVDSTSTGTITTPSWTVTLPAAIGANATFTSLPFTGLAAGDGLLVVPAGTKVTAFVLSTNP